MSSAALSSAAAPLVRRVFLKVKGITAEIPLPVGPHETLGDVRVRFAGPGMDAARLLADLRIVPKRQWAHVTASIANEESFIAANAPSRDGTVVAAGTHILVVLYTPVGGGGADLAAALQPLVAAVGRLELRMDAGDADAGSLVSPHSHNPSYEHLAYRYIIYNMPVLFGWTVMDRIPIQRFEGDLSDFEWDARVFLNSVPLSGAGTLSLVAPDGRDFIVYGGHAAFNKPAQVEARPLSPFRRRSSKRERVLAEFIGIFEVTRVFDWTIQSGTRGPLLPRLELRLNVSLERAIAVAHEVGSRVPRDILDVVGVIGVCGISDCAPAVNSRLTSAAGRGEFPLLAQLCDAGRFIFLRVVERQVPSRFAPPPTTEAIPEAAVLDTSGSSNSAAPGGDSGRGRRRRDGARRRGGRGGSGGGRGGGRGGRGGGRGGRGAGRGAAAVGTNR